MEYLPSLRLAVLLVVPLMTMETPDSGAFCSLVTLPVMVFCCPNAREATRRIPTNSVTARLVMTAIGFGATVAFARRAPKGVVLSRHYDVATTPQPNSRARTPDSPCRP